MVGTRKLAPYYAFVGIDGVGKSLQAKMLSKRLHAENRITYAISEPSEFAADGRIVREILSGRRESYPLELECRFAVDRLAQARTATIPMRRAGITVIADRCYICGVAYALALRGPALHAEIAKAAAALQHGKVESRPSRVIWLDLSPLEAARRTRDCEGTQSLYDTDVEFLTRAAEAYGRVLMYWQPDFVRIDASGTPDEVHARIVEAIGETRSAA